MNIRRAIVADAADIGRVHVASLRSSHMNLLPESFLNNLSADGRAKVWRRLLAERAQTHFIFVAEMDGHLVGFCACGPETAGRSDYSDEIYTLYLVAEAQGQKAGRRLLKAALDEFAHRGASSVLLWVLKDNAAARGFYEHMGGMLIDEKQEDFGGVTMSQVAYGWSLSQSKTPVEAIL